MISLGVLISVLSTSSFAESKSGNVELTSTNFKQTIGSGATFVKFFAPWCPHCVSMGPDWDQLAGQVAEDGELKSKVKVGQVDCTEQPRLCGEQNVQGYPTIHLYENGKLHEKYMFNRDLDSMKSFLYGKFGSELSPNPLGIYELDSKTWDRFHMGRSSYVIVYFKTAGNQACSDFEPVYHELAVTFEMEESEDIVFTEVDCKVNEDLCKLESVDSMPAVSLYKRGDIEDLYVGDFSQVESLMNFVWETVDPSRVDADESNSDFDMLQLLNNLKQSTTDDDLDEDEEEDYADEADENNDEDDDDDYIDIMEDFESDTVRVLKELIEEETKEEVKAVLNAKLKEVESKSSEEILGPAYDILKEQLKNDDQNSNSDEKSKDNDHKSDTEKLSTSSEQDSDKEESISEKDEL